MERYEAPLAGSTAGVLFTIYLLQQTSRPDGVRLVVAANGERHGSGVVAEGQGRTTTGGRRWPGCPISGGHRLKSAPA